MSRQVDNSPPGLREGKSNFLLKSLPLILKRCNLEMSWWLWLGCAPGHPKGIRMGTWEVFGEQGGAGRGGGRGCAGFQPSLKGQCEGGWCGRRRAEEGGWQGLTRQRKRLTDGPKCGHALGRIPSLAWVQGWPSTSSLSVLWGQCRRRFHGAEAQIHLKDSAFRSLSWKAPRCWVNR